MKPTSIPELMLANDVVVLAETEENLQHNINILNEEVTITNMKINIETKISGKNTKEKPRRT